MNEIYTRRSIRSFTDQVVEKEKVDKMLRAAMQAPSSCNQQPWEFLVIDSEPMLSKIKTIKNNTRPIQTSPVIIVLAHKNDIPKIGKVQQDLGCAAQNMMLEAVTQGLGTVWIGTYPDDAVMTQVREATDMPDDMTPYAVFGVGYPDKDQNRFVDRFKPERVHYNKW